MNPSYILIVYTSSTRFDLSGNFADILVPLYLKDEEKFQQLNFGLAKFRIKHYNIIKDFYYNKYRNRFEIAKHFYPDIEAWKNKIKWQFPRNMMNYDFQPRTDNDEAISDLFTESKNVFVIPNDSDIRHELAGRNYIVFMKHWMYDIADYSNDLNVSLVGCIIEYLKQCDFVVGNMSSWVSKLALLLKTPVISINETMCCDSIHLLNPFDIPVINCKNIEEGIDIYEDNF